MKKNNKFKLIAIDFDETITDNTPFPITGNIRPEAIKYITLLHKKGYSLILWTCRQDKYLEEALDILKQKDLLKYFKYINDDGKNRKSRKVEADFYIDDKSYIGKFNWRKVYKYIIHNIK